MILVAGKTAVIIIGFKSNTTDLVQNNTPLSTMSNVICLEVLIEQQLDFNDHVNITTVKKHSRRLTTCLGMLL